MRQVAALLVAILVVPLSWLLLAPAQRTALMLTGRNQLLVYLATPIWPKWFGHPDLVVQLRTQAALSTRVEEQLHRRSGDPGEFGLHTTAQFGPVEATKSPVRWSPDRRHTLWRFS